MNVDEETRFTEACLLRDQRRSIEAVKAYEAIILDPLSQRKFIIHSHLQAGHILKELCSYDEAEMHARQAVLLAPKNQLASLLLFHVLMSKAETMSALKEMVRFVTIKDSQMYRDLISGTYNLSPMGIEYSELVDRARRALAKWKHAGE